MPSPFEGSLEEISFDDLPLWRQDDHGRAFDAFLAGVRFGIDAPFKTRALGADGKALHALALEGLKMSAKRGAMDCEQARIFFETRFRPCRVRPGRVRQPSGADADASTGLLTGFYEPIVRASWRKNRKFSVPLYCKPPELVKIGRASGSSLPYGRKGKDGSFEAYFDRRAIQEGALDGRGLELAFVRNAVDAFFIHVQGCARLEFENGEKARIKFAAKSGHEYTSLGKVLMERLNLSSMTADRLRQWMEENPGQLDDFLALNRSYIFFEIDESSASGPLGAAKIPMIAGRSLAVDRALHTFGAPIWVGADITLGECSVKPRLMVAHDTGSAITGAARGDFFAGSGDRAGFLAGQMCHQADFFLFLPRANF